MKVESAEKDRNAVSDSDKIKENDENKDVKETTNDDKLRTCFFKYFMCKKLSCIVINFNPIIADKSEKSRKRKRSDSLSSSSSNSSSSSDSDSNVPDTPKAETCE